MAQSESLSDTIAPKRAVARVFGQPLVRFLILLFGLVLLLLSVLSIQLYNAAWRDGWREINEKHRVLAINLALPVSSYIHDRRRNLANIADSLRIHDVPNAPLLYGQTELLSAFSRGVEGVRSLSLLSIDGELVYSSVASDLSDTSRELLANNSAFFHAIARRSDYLAGIAESPFGGPPSLMLGQPVRGADGNIVGVLLAELSVEPIEALRRQVRFGVGGHAAVVDQFGRVVAHPSQDWVKSMHNLSALPVVQSMLSGETGVTEFYSPFIKQDMVVGYAAVPRLGWGVMVPQPKQEIATRVQTLLIRQAVWGILGVMLIAALAYGIALLVTRPLSTVLKKDVDQPQKKTPPTPFRSERRR